jgi:type II secretory pathway pseudopilin PulG
MKKFFQKFRADATGFTLVEITVVLFIVSLALVGVLTLIVQNISSQSYNKDNLIAYQLAQEGIELIRKTRDSNWRAGSAFNAGLSDGDYFMDYRAAAPSPAAGNPDLFILKQDSNGFYFHDLSSPAAASGFSRKLTIQNLDAHTLRVVAGVTWHNHDRNYSYNLETLLYDWR